MEAELDRRIDPRRQRTIDALLASADELFARRGVDEVTVGEIGRRAGVAVSSIYNNFGSKAGLHAALLDRALDLDREYMDRAYTPDRTPVEQLLAASEQYLRFALEHPRHFRMLAFPVPGEARPGAAETLERLSRRIREQNARMSAAIRRGVAEGDLRAVDPDRMATLLWASWNGVIALAWRADGLREDPDSLRDLLERAADVVSSGLLTRSAPG